MVKSPGRCKSCCRPRLNYPDPCEGVVCDTCVDYGSVELFGVPFPEIYEVPDLFQEFDVQSWSDYFQLYYVGDSTWESDTFDAGPCAVNIDDPYYDAATQIGRISATLVVNGLDAGDVTLTVTVETFLDEDDDGEPDEGLNLYQWVFTNPVEIANGLCSILVKKTGFTDDATYPIADNLTCNEDKNCMCVIPVEERELVCGREFGEGCIKDESIEYYVTVLGIQWARFYVVRKPLSSAGLNPTMVSYDGGSSTTWSDTGTTTMTVTGTGPQEITIVYDGKTYTNTTDIDPLCPFNAKTDEGDLICIIPTTRPIADNTCCDRYSRPSVAMVEVLDFETTTGIGGEVIGSFEVLDYAGSTSVGDPGGGTDFSSCSYGNDIWDQRPIEDRYAKTEPYLVNLRVYYVCGTGEFGEGALRLWATIEVTENLTSYRGTIVSCEQDDFLTDVEVDGQTTFELPFNRLAGPPDGVFQSPQTSALIGFGTDARVRVTFSEPFTIE